MAEFSMVQCSRCGEEVPISACYQEGSPMKPTCTDCVGVFARSRDPEDALMEAEECVREWREDNDPEYGEEL